MKGSKELNIKEIESGFRFHYKRLNTHFSEHDRGESYLRPINAHIDIYYKKISNHYLISTKEYFGLRKHQKEIAILDNAPKKEIRKKCLELFLKEVKGESIA